MDLLSVFSWSTLNNSKCTLLMLGAVHFLWTELHLSTGFFQSANAPRTLEENPLSSSPWRDDYMSSIPHSRRTENMGWVAGQS